MSCHLRQKIYLIGYYSSGLTGSKLPSNKEVLKVLFFNMREVKLSLRESARLTIKEVVIFWEKARIPIREQKHCVNKLENLYQEWRGLQKHANRKNVRDQQREAEFFKKLEGLFDLAHANALELITIEEDKNFLINQRQEGRPGYMYGLDYNEIRRERRSEEKRQIVLRRKERSMLQTEENRSVPLLLSSESENSSSNNEVSEQENIEFNLEMEAAPTSRKRARGKIEIVNQKIAAVLDACKISDRNAVRIIAATVQSLGHDLNSYILNKSSIRIARQSLRSERVDELKKQFNVSELDAVCLHWDGKLLPALEGKQKVDRLPVIISNGSVEHLLEVPALENSTGRAQASAICKSIFEWGLQDHVQALVFDTTAVNTGHFNGTCRIIENLLERDLLYLACRHHIFEIILKSVFHVKVCKSDSPNVELFQRFQNFWSKINVGNFKFGIDNEKVRKNISSDDVFRITSFLNNIRKDKQPREDYEELLELALIFLGEKPHSSVKFRAPGAMHHARWMAKAIYTLKIFLFRNEFKLSEEEENSLCDISIFIIKVYVEVWFSASSSIKAPFQDFNLLSILNQYESIDRDISRVALDKFCKHLWYLSAELVGLAFFDSNISVEIKAKMVSNLNIERDDMDIKRVLIDRAKISEIVEKGIEQFVCKNTKNIFNRFKLSDDFLKISPSEWHENISFIQAKNTLFGLRVVNDTAERGVKLMQDYNSILTKNENQKQYILKIVTDYRRRFPNCNKNTLFEQL